MFRDFVRFNFMLKNIKQLLRLKLNPGIQKQFDNPKFHNLGFSVCLWIPGFNFRLSNFFMFFNMKLKRARSSKIGAFKTWETPSRALRIQESAR